MVIKDEASVFDSYFSLMADIKTDKDNPVTLHDIKENLMDYSFSRLKSLTSVLIDSLDDPAKDKEHLREALENFEDEIVKLSIQIAKLKNEKAKLIEVLSKYEDKMVI